MTGASEDVFPTVLFRPLPLARTLGSVKSARMVLASGLVAAIAAVPAVAAPRVLCVHGSLADYDNLEEQVRVLERDDTLRVVDQTGGGVWPVAYDGRTNPSWSPDGSALAYGANLSVLGPAMVTAELRVADLRRVVPRTRLTIPVAGFLYDVAWSPRGDRIAFTLDTVNTAVRAATWTDVGDRSTVWVVNADGSGLRPVSVLAGATFDWGPAWAPDGHRLAYVASGLVQVVDVDSALPATPAWDVRNGDVRTVRWSPDGRRLAVAYRPGVAADPEAFVTNLLDYGWDLVTMSPDGTARRTLVRNVDAELSWRPDGGEIAAVRVGATPSLIAVNTRSGRQRTMAIPPPQHGFAHPAWSPDGRVLGFAVSGPAGKRLAMVDGNGGPWRTILAAETGWSMGPVWCPGR